MAIRPPLNGRSRQLHSMLWAPEPSSVHRNRCRTWIRSSNEDSHRKWIEGGDYGLCIEDVRDEIWDMVKPVDLH
ncbi:putative serine/threonine-protein phosphatase 2A regulatory subunit B'' subunit TON2 [Gossypium australe]|uniref:Putative serine/threonine-protein phosphatase 2A regulatory subunit B'' subunit TON2 n=1 Tax=Gossypium australe TaxID=47621 RepID=A0A5B6UG05_9ROSI|nr:putative serine/threonine-protein phosphatase 2A regulatory subunit B'' subunit TON2 [Gossypium australe]